MSEAKTLAPQNRRAVHCGHRIVQSGHVGCEKVLARIG